MNICWVDWETYSTLDLRKVGSYRYAENCEILLGAYAWNDGPVKVHDFTEDPVFPVDLAEMLEKCDVIGAHNGMLFDRVVAEKSQYAFFFPEDKPWRDTMVRAYSHSLPGGLGLLSQIFNLSEDEAKKKEGKQLIHLFCKPQGKHRKITRATRLTHPEEWKKFKEYAGNDIVAMRLIDKKIPHWNETQFERDLQRADRTMNDRGFAVDLGFCRAAIKVLSEEKSRRDDRTSELTKETVDAATQRDALLKYICDVWGVWLPDMKKSTLERRMNDSDIPDVVKELIMLRLESAGTSTKKYQSIIDAACADGRIRGTQQFRGAFRTGRWGGRLIQPHNMPRAHKDYKYNKDPKKDGFWKILHGIEALKGGYFDLCFERDIHFFSTAIRSVITASPGGTLGVSDLSAIEGRGLAYLAGEEWKLKAYRDYDAGIGHDLYILTYAMTFGCSPEEVTSTQRQLGKVLELALGYGGGVGAFITFANAYGISLDELATEMYDRLPKWAVDSATVWWEESVRRGKTYDLKKETFVTLDAIKRMWRAANPDTVKLWRDLEDGARDVLNGVRATASAGLLTIDRKGTWLRIRLPSGRYLSYPGARVTDKNITYLGLNTYTRKWCNITTHGPKMSENATQGFAADVFGYGLVQAEEAGCNPILCVHDEQAAESEVKKLIKIMSTNPPWAPDIPLAAAGFEGFRYRKD